MKRLWLGAGILLVLLSAGIVLTISFHNIHAPLSVMLEEAAMESLDGNSDAAQLLAQQAKQRWEQYRETTATMADHAPLEEMDALFSLLDIYLRLDWRGDFAALCMQLSKLAAAMEESQTLTWWTLL